MPQWRVVDEHYLECTFKFKNFREALAFTNRIGELAEEQGHHPDIYLSWGRVGIKIWTHKIDGQINPIRDVALLKTQDITSPRQPF